MKISVDEKEYEALVTFKIFGKTIYEEWLASLSEREKKLKKYTITEMDNAYNVCDKFQAIKEEYIKQLREEHEHLKTEHEKSNS